MKREAYFDNLQCRRSLNFIDMLKSLQDQFDSLDFIAETDRAKEEMEAYEEYYLEDPDDHPHNINDSP